MKASILLAGMLAAASASAVSMSRVGVFSLSGEGNTSGITYAGGSIYYVIDDKGFVGTDLWGQTLSGAFKIRCF